MNRDFDLTPDPRVLQMLGEINLDQWKCLAELVDNSIDGFINAKRGAESISTPEVLVSLPTVDRQDAFIVVRDNGPGMSIDQLERAVTAGWSGNNPLDNLGLFGMGFNIATARLGLITEVRTTRKGDLEWTGLQIDLDELRRIRSYVVPRQMFVKPDPNVHGTEVRIGRLKPEQRTYFARGSNHQKIRKQLARIYAPLLLSKDGKFELQANGQSIEPKRHCFWDPNRQVSGPDGRPVSPVEFFDYPLPPRRYCLTCITTLTGFADGPCPQCGENGQIVEIQRRIHGWVGIQRHLHEEDYGVDLIRNGRVIEPRNKDLFIWTDGELPTREYPIDDQRNRGRFIGEIHMDHCRVSYTKDRFERDDPAWKEMVALIRGEGPLQPQKARERGYVSNNAPLFRLFQAFRRSSPQGKVGRWSRILVVKNNDRALEMAEAFDRGDPEYQTDERWWQLVEEEDRAIVGAMPDVNAPNTPSPEIPEGFLDPPASPSQPSTGPSPTPTQPPRRDHLYELSRKYTHPFIKLDFLIEAFLVGPTDPDVPPGAPWVMRMADPATRTYSFLIQPDHDVYRSATMSYLDGLLMELAIMIVDFLKDMRPTDAVFSTILAELRREYSTESRLDSKEIIARADVVLRDIALSIAEIVSGKTSESLFKGLAEGTKEYIRRKLASSGITNLKQIVLSGEFLSYASAEDIRRFVTQNPNLFFDGKFWDQPYASLDYGSEWANQAARQRVLERYDAYLSDAVWLASQSPRDLDRSNRDELIRAALSLRLLRPDKAS